MGENDTDADSWIRATTINIPSYFTSQRRRVITSNPLLHPQPRLPSYALTQSSPHPQPRHPLATTRFRNLHHTASSEFSFHSYASSPTTSRAVFYRSSSSTISRAPTPASSASASSESSTLTMAILSQADVEAIVDALVDAILKRNPLHPQTPAQAVFTPDLIVDDCYPAGDVFISVDAIVDNCYSVENVKDVDDCWTCW